MVVMSILKLLVESYECQAYWGDMKVGAGNFTIVLQRVCSIYQITYRVWSSSKCNVTFTSSQSWKYCRNFKMYDYLNKLFNLNSSYNSITFYTNILSILKLLVESYECQAYWGDMKVGAGNFTIVLQSVGYQKQQIT
jgi:predicted NAD-dependent protein-ADP-ribosyltransferase YbiA (DUF1768 family)